MPPCKYCGATDGMRYYSLDRRSLICKACYDAAQQERTRKERDAMIGKQRRWFGAFDSRVTVVGHQKGWLLVQTTDGKTHRVRPWNVLP